MVSATSITISQRICEGVTKRVVDYRLVIELERCVRVRDALIYLKLDASSDQRLSTIEDSLLRLNQRIMELEEAVEI